MPDPATLIQVISAVVASVTALASIYFSMRTRRDGIMQQRVQVLSLKGQFDSDLRKWAEEVSERMTESIFLCDLDPTKLPDEAFSSRRHELCTKLSALVDRGRWFLPNVREDEHGQHKPAAYRGFRQPSLSCVVEAFRLVTEFNDLEQDPDRELQTQLIETKREFVAELQNILKPREREQETTKLIQSVKGF
jgi:hypothetical protein